MDIAQHNIEIGANRNTWRVFRNGDQKSHLNGWALTERSAWSDFAYVASGRCSQSALYLSFWHVLIEFTDRNLGQIHIPTFAARMLVVLEK